MYIWKNQQTVLQAMPNLIRRKCWDKCNRCLRKWSDNKSDYVNMIKTSDGVRYICDKCVTIYESEVEEET